jgi:2-oxoglutarate dehydrogenase E2 component (dihydrolipoamide succinyltransferase)
MIPIKVPPLGESIVEATVSRWLKREGEAVAAGETVVELETDKVTVEVPATTSGVLVRRAHQEGDVVALGALLGELDESAAGRPAVTPAPEAEHPAPVPSAPPPPVPAPAPPLTVAPGAGAAETAVRASPALAVWRPMRASTSPPSRVRGGAAW